MIVKYSPKVLDKLKKSNVRIRKSFKERILIFSKNPYDMELNNHLLKEPYLGCRSIDITADWRAIYEEMQIGEEIEAYFLILGTHGELFRNSEINNNFDS